MPRRPRTRRSREPEWAKISSELVESRSRIAQVLGWVMFACLIGWWLLIIAFGVLVAAFVLLVLGVPIFTVLIEMLFGVELWGLGLPGRSAVAG